MIVSTSLGLAQQAEPATKPPKETEPAIIVESYPDLASGGLSYAALAELPQGTVLRSGSLEITQMKLDAEISKVPANIRDQLKKNSFFLLEQMATQELLLAEAKTELTKAKEDPSGKNSRQILSEYLQGLTDKVKVTEAETTAFYEENKAMFGGEENVNLALQIGKFIGRNEINQEEFTEIQESVNRLCSSNEKARRIMETLKREGELQKLVKLVVGQNPGAYMIVDPNGEVLRDGKGDPVPNLMKISLAIAREIETEL